MTDGFRSRGTNSFRWMFLFALPFAIMGIVMALWAGSDLMRWNRMKSWIPAECRILESNLLEASGSDSATWRVTASYRYEIEGRTYVSDRVSTSVGSDNIGDFHRALYRKLEIHRRNGTMAPCWVNPEDHREALLYREMRWDLFLFKLAFVLTFGVVGFGLFGYAMKKGAQENRQEELIPEPDFSGTIPSASTHPGIFLVMAVVFLGLSAGIFLPILKEIRAGNRLALLFFLFPLAGIGLLTGAVHGFMRRRRFGRSSLRLLTPSPQPGGRLKGEVRISEPMAMDFIVRIQAFVKDEETDSGRQPLWTADQSVRSVAYGSFSLVPFSFQLPDRLEIPGMASPPKLLVSMLRRLYPRATIPIDWVLDLKAEVPGVDFNETFRLPREGEGFTLQLPEGWAE